MESSGNAVNESVTRLPDDALGAGVDRLHLGRKTRDALAAVGLWSIGDLTTHGYLRQEVWSALGIAGGKQVSSALHDLASCADAGQVDWFRYWAQRGVTVVPEETKSEEGVRDLLAALPQVLHAALRDDARADADPERDWVIIDARYGLVSAPRTLEAIGTGALKITRARVQQLEAKAKVRLRRAWEERFAGSTYRLHPGLQPALAAVAACVPDERGVVFEDELLRILGLSDRRDSREERRLGFLLSLGGAVRVEGDGERRPAFWHASTDSHGKALVSLADRIGQILIHTADAMTETDLVIELNRGHRAGLVTLDEVRAAMPFCRVAEQLDDGRWRGRFEFLARRGDQAYRVVAAAGRPVDLDVVVREINAKTRGRSLTVRNLANQLSEDARFVPVGRSGEWGLRSEHAEDARPIVEMMLEALRRAGRPMAAGEIQAAVAARRKVADASVPMYLQLRPEFALLSDGTWALSDWPEAVANAAPKIERRPRVRRQPSLADRITDVVVPYLQAAPEGERDLSDVVTHVSETLGIIRNTVYSYLHRVAAVARVEREGRLRVRLVEALSQDAAFGVDRLRALMEAGETPRVEFKSTLRWDVRQGTDNPGLQKMCTKTIAAFSNTSGGTLVIGVGPDGGVLGIEADCSLLQRKDDTCVDAFSRALAGIVSQHLGGAVAARMVTHYPVLRDKTVCVVEVPASHEPVYLRDGKSIEFYVRNGTTSRALELPDVAPYIRSHWS